METISKNNVLDIIQKLKSELDTFEVDYVSSLKPAINIPAFFMVQDTNGEILYGDFKALESLGYKLEDLDRRGEKIYQENLNTDFQENIAKNFKAVAGGEYETRSYVAEIRHRKGEFHLFNLVSTVHKKDKKGTPKQILTIGTDISAIKVNDNQFKRSMNKALWSLVTKRERQIVQLIMQGFKNNDIAKELGITVRTVETHRKNLAKKLNVGNTAALIKFVNDNRLPL
ncbi:LuxR C-terminal-related transcriptional regulator [Rapidithrix thailandica]|uniref:LuxR C-terminal-related transcriptional regulator n=1 Tax=Rapidithrix thailandica TaxID=413964 RepID=A0AAW9S2U5_9BACT